MLTESELLDDVVICLVNKVYEMLEESGNHVMNPCFACLFEELLDDFELLDSETLDGTCDESMSCRTIKRVDCESRVFVSH